MKNGKLLLLLVAVLCLSMVFASCDTSATGDTSEPVSETTAVENAPAVEQEEVEHEIRDYFVIDNGIDSVSFAEISKLNGEILEIDDENNLISLVTKDLDNYNNVIETVKVYDILTGKCIREDSITYPLYASGEDFVELKVDIDYPIIRVSKISYYEDSYGLNPSYDISYYFAKENSEIIRSSSNTNYSKTNFYNGLVAIEMGDEVVWINRNMEVVRTVDAVAANGYDINVFNAEYQDYLYAWDDEAVQVFNKAGLCSAKYTIQHDGVLNVHVLNDGNVLIQDFEIVDEFTPCDFTWITNNSGPITYSSVQRIVMKSYVMSCTDGSIKEVELDYIVESLETAYEGRLGNNYFPFALAGNGQNQAIIYRVANGSLSLWQEYVSLGNDLEIKYSVKNNCIGVDFTSAEVINSNLYAMDVYEAGVWHSYVFDLDGNKISPANYYSADVTDTYIVTENAIYDHKMNVVYDISASDFADNGCYVISSTNTIYMFKYNFNTGANEIFVFDHASKSPKLLVDGINTIFETFGDGYYVTYDVNECHYNFVSTEGKTILKAYKIDDITVCNGAIVVETEFEGNTLTYIIK